MVVGVSVSKERQVKFLEETISKLESFKQQVVNGEVFIEDASMNTGNDMPTRDDPGGNNIYISIDYISSEEHHMNKVVRNL